MNELSKSLVFFLKSPNFFSRVLIISSSYLYFSSFISSSSLFVLFFILSTKLVFICSSISFILFSNSFFKSSKFWFGLFSFSSYNSWNFLSFESIKFFKFSNSSFNFNSPSFKSLISPSFFSFFIVKFSTFFLDLIISPASCLYLKSTISNFLKTLSSKDFTKSFAISTDPSPLSWTILKISKLELFIVKSSINFSCSSLFWKTSFILLSIIVKDDLFSNNSFFMSFKNWTLLFLNCFSICLLIFPSKFAIFSVFSLIFFIISAINSKFNSEFCWDWGLFGKEKFANIFSLIRPPNLTLNLFLLLLPGILSSSSEFSFTCFSFSFSFSLSFSFSFLLTSFSFMSSDLSWFLISSVLISFSLFWFSSLGEYSILLEFSTLLAGSIFVIFILKSAGLILISFFSSKLEIRVSWYFAWFFKATISDCISFWYSAKLNRISLKRSYWKRADKLYSFDFMFIIFLFFLLINL